MEMLIAFIQLVVYCTVFLCLIPSITKIVGNKIIVKYVFAAYLFCLWIHNITGLIYYGYVVFNYIFFYNYLHNHYITYLLGVLFHLSGHALVFSYAQLLIERILIITQKFYALFYAKYMLTILWSADEFMNIIGFAFYQLPKLEAFSSK